MIMVMEMITIRFDQVMVRVMITRQFGSGIRSSLLMSKP